MKVLISAGAIVLLQSPQQIWRNEESIPVAIFAGKPMLLVEGGEDAEGGYELSFLDFKSEKFLTK